MYKDRKDRGALVKHHRFVSDAMYNGKEKKYLGSVDIVCNEPVSGNRILVSKTASYVAYPETYTSKLSYPDACDLVSVVIPDFQEELSKQENQRIYSNDYKIHLMRLINTFIKNAKLKSKDETNELTKTEKLASSLKAFPFNNLDFITVRFQNVVVRPRTSEEIASR